MKVWCELGADGRPTSIWETDMSAAGLGEYELPEGVDALGLGDYVWDGEGWAYDGAATAAREEAARSAQREALRESQLSAAAERYVRAESASGALDRRSAVGLSTLLDEWSGDGVRYAAGGWLSYGGDVYHIETTHTSQPDWAPDASPSLFTRIPLAPDGVRVWERPTHAENAFDLDERAHYPGEDGEIWVSLIDGNTTEPGSDPRWWSKEGGAS